MKLYKYIKLVLFVAFSALIIVFADSLLDNLHYFIPALMMAFGLEDVLITVFEKKKECFKEFPFLYGLLEMLIGVIAIIFVRDFENICIIWAIWSMIRELLELYEIFNGEIKGAMAIISFIESLVVMVFSILLIITPTEHHAKTHIYLLIAELIITAFSPVFESLFIFPKKDAKE